MNELTERRPAYYTGFENETYQFKTVNELLELEWVKNFAKRDDFHRFTVSGRGKDKRYNRLMLMAEYKNGEEFWAIGFLKEDVPELAGWRLPNSKVAESFRPLLPEKKATQVRKIQDELMQAIHNVIGMKL